MRSQRSPTARPTSSTCTFPRRIRRPSGIAARSTFARRRLLSRFAGLFRPPAWPDARRASSRSLAGPRQPWSCRATTPGARKCGGHCPDGAPKTSASRMEANGIRALCCSSTLPDSKIAADRRGADQPDVCPRFRRRPDSERSPSITIEALRLRRLIHRGSAIVPVDVQLRSRSSRFWLRRLQHRSRNRPASRRDFLFHPLRSTAAA